MLSLVLFLITSPVGEIRAIRTGQNKEQLNLLESIYMTDMFWKGEIAHK